ncbi:hypothetical protein [Paraburkholderia sp.]|uniref:hypothetical protein n=1 Tax=Paraburkholderia sp. TaxID=1926495 RepID=UPI0025E72939|nr:hypothetical protein [Paraburkholderia sp.]
MKDRYDQKTLELPLGDDAPAADAPKKRGRPALHENAAAKQKAYRERLKARGMRTASRVVRDCRGNTARLHSDIIDLSEVRGCR